MNMFTKKELLSSPEYHLDNVQNEVFRILEDYRIENNFNRTQLAENLGYSKGYISQLLNGRFNHSVLKLFELAQKVNKYPEIKFRDLDEIESISSSNQRVVPILALSKEQSLHEVVKSETIQVVVQKRLEGTPKVIQLTTSNTTHYDFSETKLESNGSY